MSTIITNLRKWGNSAGVVIPANALAKCGFTVGDDLEVEAKNGQLIIKSAIKGVTLESLLEGVKPEMVKLDEDDRQWLGAAVGGEVADPLIIP